MDAKSEYAVDISFIVVTELMGVVVGFGGTILEAGIRLYPFLLFTGRRVCLIRWIQYPILTKKEVLGNLYPLNSRDLARCIWG